MTTKKLLPLATLAVSLTAMAVLVAACAATSDYSSGYYGTPVTTYSQGTATGQSGTAGTGNQNTVGDLIAQANTDTQEPPPPPPAEPPIVGTVVPGNNLAEKFAWLSRSAESHGTYILEVNANENIAPQKLEYPGGVNITVALRGDDANRTIRLTTNDTMFTVSPNVTLILDNITLHGHRRERGTMVTVEGGMLTMNTGSAIINNIATGSNLYGAGVTIRQNGTFVMNGGIISGNSVSGGGGGVSNEGTFTMNGGTISGNTASTGGGVYNTGTFEMKGGTISGNTATNQGGGIYLNRTKSTMQHGIISGNTAAYGGGVYVDGLMGSGFTIQNGIITGNTAMEYGGGVFINGGAMQWVSFTKSRGTITGYPSDNENGNVVKDSDGYVLARRGHAVFFNTNTHRENTAGPSVSLYATRSGNLTSDQNGGWEQ